MKLSELEHHLAGCKPRTRFAPTPSGDLHLGHVAHCIYLWGISKALNGTIVFRMEDHDSRRCKHEHKLSILNDLEWLGFEADEGYDQGVGFRDNFQQSSGAKIYATAVKHLQESCLTYWCRCSRKQIRDRLIPQKDMRGYDGFCRTLDHPESSKVSSLRVHIPTQEFHFWDALHGWQYQNPHKDSGDVLLMNRDRDYTYHLCAVVDDLRQGINLIVRGRDLISSTGPQLFLRHALLSKRNGELANSDLVFIHHPLISRHDDSSVKLSKSLKDEGLARYRNTGYTPNELIGHVVFELGLTKKYKPMAVSDLKHLWT